MTDAPRLSGALAVFAHLKIKTKVLFGFMIVLVLLGVVGGVSVSGFGSISTSLGLYQLTATNAVAVAVLDRDLVLVRRNVLGYYSTGDATMVQRVRDGGADTKKDLAALLPRVTTPERRAKLTDVGQIIDTYLGNFDKFVALRATTDKLRADRLVSGPKVDQAFTDVLNVIIADNDFGLSLAGNTAQNAANNARLDATRFLANIEPKGAETANRDLDAAVQEATKFAARLQDPAQRQRMQEGAAALTQYAASFRESAKGLLEADTLVNKTMADLGLVMANTLADVRKSQIAQLEQVSAATEAAVGTSSSLALYLSVGAFVLGLGLAWLLGRGISGPVVGMTAAMKALAGGDKTVIIPAQGRHDEIGEMAGAVEIFKHNMIEADRLRGEQEQMKTRAEAEKRATMNKMADEFEAGVKGIVQMVSSSSTELQATAQSMSATAEETSRQSTAVAAASEQASTNVQTVASAAEELSSSISEITRQVTESARIAGQASEQASATNVQIQGLAESAQRIGDVVKLINDIAGQTNLLALNATIEAARAGEAGKGFAVVASEVKSLATQTAKATEEISSKIAEMQAATGQSVQAVKTIGQTIGRINEIATTIASAVEEQGAATKEIARNVQQASAGTGEVSANISGVTKAASDTGAAANQVLGAAGELSKQSENLQTQVDGFIAKIRAA